MQNMIFGKLFLRKSCIVDVELGSKYDPHINENLNS